MFTTPVFPVVIFDTKGEQIFDDFKEREGVIFTENSQDTILAIQSYPLVVYRPNPEELMDVELIDTVLQFIYDFIEGCVVAVDEAYTIHTSTSQIPKGYFSIITRGRSKNITLISCMQRPKHISRFLLSETDEFFIFALNDIEDRQRVYDIIAYDEIIEIIPRKYSFFWYSFDTDRLYLMRPIEPDPEVEQNFFENLIDYMSKKHYLI